MNFVLWILRMLRGGGGCVYISGEVAVVKGSLFHASGSWRLLGEVVQGVRWKEGL